LSGGLFFMLAECRNWDTVPHRGRAAEHHANAHQGIPGRSKIRSRDDAGHGARV
jgi:hypothetical protein